MAFDYVPSSGYFNMYHIKMFPKTKLYTVFFLLHSTEKFTPSGKINVDI
jgi:hypothetical protein